VLSRELDAHWTTEAVKTARCDQLRHSPGEDSSLPPPGLTSGGETKRVTTWRQRQHCLEQWRRGTEGTSVACGTDAGVTSSHHQQVQSNHGTDRSEVANIDMRMRASSHIQYPRLANRQYNICFRSRYCSSLLFGTCPLSASTRARTLLLRLDIVFASASIEKVNSVTLVIPYVAKVESVIVVVQ
jgi:hypothetical protein